MKRFVAATGTLAALVLCACSSTPDDRPPAGAPSLAADSGTAPATDASSPATSETGDAAGPPAPTGADAAANQPVDAALFGDATSSSPDSGPISVAPASDAAMAEPVCSLSATWSPPTVVAGLPVFSSQPFVTMTPDELTVAWVLDNGLGGDVFVADRAAATDPFGTPSTFGSSSILDGIADAALLPEEAGSPLGYFAFDRVGLSADGLTLIGVSTLGTQMAQFIRTTRSGPFASLALPTRYNGLANLLTLGQLFSDPVLSADGDDFVYSQYGLGSGASIYESFQTGTNAWPAGIEQLAASLLMTEGMRMRPTCLSSDRRTLFYWDPVSSMAYGVFRNGVTDAFSSVAIAYGAFFSVQANAACSRLYYVAPGAGGFQLVSVDAQ